MWHWIFRHLPCRWFHRHRHWRYLGSSGYSNRTCDIHYFCELCRRYIDEDMS